MHPAVQHSRLAGPCVAPLPASGTHKRLAASQTAGTALPILPAVRRHAKGILPHRHAAPPTAAQPTHTDVPPYDPAGTYVSTTFGYTYWFVNSVTKNFQDANNYCYTQYGGSLLWYTNSTELSEVEAAFAANSASNGYSTASNVYRWVGLFVRAGGCKLHPCVKAFGCINACMAQGWVRRCGKLHASMRARPAVPGCASFLL